MTVTVLDRELYSAGEAARLLSMPTSTLQWWLNGGARQGKTYPPILRSEPARDQLVTWAEFVEARLLKGYRSANVSMQSIRPFVETLRNEMGIPYPLADRRPFIDASRHLVYEIQKDIHLEDDLYLVRPADGQLELSDPAKAFLEVVEFDDDAVAAILPFGKGSPIRIDPTRRFGEPQIGGVRVDSIVETAEAESPEVAAEAWEIDIGDVMEALRWRDRRAA